MPYPIKNTTLVQTNSINSASFGLGVNQGGYGLTSVTSFWNGRPPNIGGYVVYVDDGVNTSTSSPTMYIAVNDNDLITLSNTLGLGTNYNIGGALNSFIYSGIYSVQSVCLNNEPLNIVTSGLTVYLDAGFTPSYPRAYATWFDLTKNGNNASLVNSPTYSSDLEGSLIFDGVNQYSDISLPNALSYTTITICGFIKWLSFGGDMFLGMSLYDVWTSGNCLGYNNANGNVVGINAATVTSLGLLGNWKHYTFVMNSSGLLSTNKIYIDGVSVGALTPVVGSDGTIPGFNTTLRLCDWLEGGYYGNLQFSNLMVYNRELTSSEILQNYYAGLQRIINGFSQITLYLDSENTNTRVITPTIAYDRGVDRINGVLMNGMGLVHRDGGQASFSFDGVSNYIDCGSPTQLVGATGELTVSVWFKILTTPTGSSPIIKFGGTNGGWLIGVSSSGLYYSLYTTSNNYIAGGLGTISLNVWYNVTFTFNGTVYVLYLNGSQVATSTSSSGTIVNGGSTVVTIGRDANTTFNYFKGYISIVRAYSKTLTSTQVSTIYTAGKPRHGL